MPFGMSKLFRKIIGSRRTVHQDMKEQGEIERQKEMQKRQQQGMQ
ncbi:MAG: hypothetical protein V1676_03880 [Candidatus Diapherotrites archaeon]